MDTVEDIRSLAEECMQAKRYDDAVSLYRKLVDMCPGDESLLLALAWAYRDSGMHQGAVDCFERLLAIELERAVFTGFAFDELIRIYKQENQYEQLVGICERVAAKQPNDIHFLGELGNAYLQAGKTDSAIEIYTKMTNMDQGDPMILCALGNALVAKGDFNGAEKVYERAVGIDPSEHATFYGRLADIYIASREYERAEKILKKCIDQRDDPARRFDLGDVLVMQGRIQEAERVYEDAIALNRNDAGVYYNRLGNTLAKAGYPVQATGIFKKAIAVDPQNPFYYLNLAKSYMSAGLPDMAAQACRDAEALRSDVKFSPSSGITL